MERCDSEVGEVGVGSGSQTLARVSVFTLHAGSSEDGGSSQESGDQELSVEEHRGNERRGWGRENGEQRGSCDEKAN